MCVCSAINPVYSCHGAFVNVCMCLSLQVHICAKRMDVCVCQAMGVLVLFISLFCWPQELFFKTSISLRDCKR